MQIYKRLQNYPVPDFVWDEYHLDQVINDRGIMIDQDLATQAIRIDALTKDELTVKLCSITLLENPNSVMQMKEKSFLLFCLLAESHPWHLQCQCCRYRSCSWMSGWNPRSGLCVWEDLFKISALMVLVTLAPG